MNYFEYTLKIDIDFKPNNPMEFAKEFARKLKFIQHLLHIFVETVEVYETNKGYHIYVYIYTNYELDDKDIVILQLALGSDYKREVFNLKRLIGKEKPKNWNVLFKVKYEKGQIISKEFASDIAVRMTRLINRLVCQS